MVGKNYLPTIGTLVFLTGSKIKWKFLNERKKNAQDQIVKFIQRGLAFSYPIGKDSIDFFVLSNKIKNLLERVHSIKNDKAKNRDLIKGNLNLFYVLNSCNSLSPSSVKRNIITYLEDKIITCLEKCQFSEEEIENLPYSITIRRNKKINNLVYELKSECIRYICKVNKVKPTYLIIPKNEIEMDNEWKKKYECNFNKNQLKIPVSKHNYEFLLYAIERSDLRRKVFELLNKPYENVCLNKHVVSILKKRWEIATTMGFEHWNHYALSQFTSESKHYEQVNTFLLLMKEKMDKEFTCISERMQTQMKLNSSFSNVDSMKNRKNKKYESSKIKIYDWFYYFNKMNKKCDEYMVNSYFPQQYVLDNYIKIISMIYNFSYEIIKEESIHKKWPKNTIIIRVQKPIKKMKNLSENFNSFSFIRSSSFLGYIYIIPYMDISWKDYFRIPSMNSLSHTFLLCNGHVVINYSFLRTVPIENKMFSTSELLTLFHEFGHAYHLLHLSSTSDISTFYSIPIDYAEFFSHINEHLFNNFSILHHLSCKEKNQSRINESIYRSIKFDCSRFFSIYTNALMDYSIHEINPNEGDNQLSESNLMNQFYKKIESFMPYNLTLLYSIHSTSFPYHFSSFQAGTVLSYLFAELRVLLFMQESINLISLRKNTSVQSFQKEFYTFLSKDYKSYFPSIIEYVLHKRKEFLHMQI